VNLVAITGVNYPFVMEAWRASQKIDPELVYFLADGTADLAKAVGLSVDLSGFGLGIRSNRYAMVIEDNVVKYVAIEDVPTSVEKTTAEAVLKHL